MTTENRRVALLASVTSEAEALIAATEGADIIDCKNPAQGALGALETAAVAAIRRALPRYLEVSATVGDLPPVPGRVLAAAQRMAATGVDIVKIGLFVSDGAATAADVLATIRHLGAHLAHETRLVAVLMADAPFDAAWIDALGAAGFHGVMLDTAHKDGRTLTDHRSPRELSEFLAASRRQGLMAGLAGSLRVAQIPELLALGPDVLGFRGALCRASDRTGALDSAAVRAVRRAIPGTGAAGPRREVLEAAS